MMIVLFLILGLIAPGLCADSVISPVSGYEENPYRSDLNLYKDLPGTYPPPVSEKVVKELSDEPFFGPLIAREFLDFSSSEGLGSLWRSTAALRDRNVHFSQSHRNVFEEQSAISATLFGDLMTSRVPLTDVVSTNFITSVVGDSAALDELERISFWQEQLGILLHGFYTYKKIGFSVDLPLSVVIEHPYAPLSSRDKLGTSFAGGDGEPLFTDEQKATLKDKLLKIPWVGGLGDIKFGVRIMDSLGEKLSWFLGGELVVPLQSGAAPKRVLSFNPVTDGFNPSLLDIGLDVEERFKYVSRALELLQAIGENPALGQKSYGFGLVGGLQLKIHPTSIVHATAQVFHQTPVKEYRLVHRYLDTSETVLAAEPGEYLVESRRGLILRGTLGLNQKITRNWSLSVGGDAFFQNKEGLYSEIFTGTEKSDKLKKAAQMGQATQVIIFGQLDKKLAMRQGKAHLSFRASGAVDSTGIGKLWNVGVCLSSTF